MYIIGLHNDVDSGACLLKDNKLLEAIGEERLRREKLYKGFPELSLNYILQKYSLKLDNIDYFVNGWNSRKGDCYSYAQILAKRVILALKQNINSATIIEERLEVENREDKKTLSEFERHMQLLGIPESKIVYLDHHHSHAWSAYATSPFDNAFVFTFDGRGDLKSASTSFATQEDGVKEFDYLLTFESLGYLYGKITNYLGYTPHRHEGKVTGLAAYGNYKKTLPLFERLILWENNTIVSNLGFFKPFYSLRKELVNELNKFSKEDIAAGVQKHCENLIVQYIDNRIKKINRPDVKNVCLAGGLFGNVKINQRVSEIKGVENVFVFPNMGDGGIPVGGACYLNYLLTGNAKVEMPTVFLGSEYTNEGIVGFLESCVDKINYKKIKNKVETTVEHLIDKKVVGYFDNRMEYGPRALGARSILFHTRDKSVNDWLNKRLQRTEFMPFAPVTPIEYAEKCYLNWSDQDKNTHFMTKTYNCTESFKKIHEAVVHVDGTARPQVVSKSLNGDYYEIVKLYCEKTGEFALINTSFNHHEEPIVCYPNDAINSLLKGSVDVLIIGDYLVSKK